MVNIFNSQETFTYIQPPVKDSDLYIYHIFSASQEKAKKKLKEAQETVTFLEEEIAQLDHGSEKKFSRKQKKTYKKKKDYMNLDALYRNLSFVNLRVLSQLLVKFIIISRIEMYVNECPMKARNLLPEYSG